jgi:hypothetical protein
VTQIAIYLDFNDPAFTFNDGRVGYTVAIIKAGLPASHNRNYVFTFGW